ncbi:MAG: hypothetical protein WDZ83_07545 [Rhizobiaceae bacterium]
MRSTKNRPDTGRYYLSTRATSPYYHATWFDAAKRQTRRVSLGTTDIREAEVRLAEFVAQNARMQEEEPAETPLATVLTRYWHGHVCTLDREGRLVRIRSHEQQKYGLALWNEYWGEALVSDLTVVRQKEFISWLKSRSYKNS